MNSFINVEDYLAANDLSNASSELAGIIPVNAVETNYFNYYSLYLEYAKNNFEPTNDLDRISLESLSALCPGTDGSCVYQARALYNTVFNTPVSYPVCGGSGARTSKKPGENKIEDFPTITLYPNPTDDKINIRSSIPDQELVITISDLSGRMVFSKQIKMSGFLVTLDLKLDEGAYLIQFIKIDNNLLHTKKLIIAR